MDRSPCIIFALLVSKTIGGKPGATRAALGTANGKVETKPTIRTTRAQELRNKMIEKKNQKNVKPMAKKEAKPEPEPMDVSMNEDYDQVRSEFAASNMI